MFHLKDRDYFDEKVVEFLLLYAGGNWPQFLSLNLLKSGKIEPQLLNNRLLSDVAVCTRFCSTTETPFVPFINTTFMANFFWTEYFGCVPVRIPLIGWDVT